LYPKLNDMSNYLTPEKKAYYQNEFAKVLQCKDTDWDLDKGLLSILTEINKNPNIQTILSKRSENLTKSNDSYLHFTFTKEVEEKLKRILWRMKTTFERKGNGNGLGVKYYAAEHFSDMEVDESEVDQNIKNLDCVTNVKNYIDIDSLFVQLFSFNERVHESFWETLKKELGSVTK